MREHHWQPAVIGGLFVDEIDQDGLFFWYEDVKQTIRELKGKNQ